MANLSKPLTLECCPLQLIYHTIHLHLRIMIIYSKQNELLNVLSFEVSEYVYHAHCVVTTVVNYQPDISKICLYT